jgi:hypothetical protein
VDGPVDDGNLSAMQRQLAAARVLDAVFPMAETTVELELPTDPEAMSWADMQRLAARPLLDETPASQPLGIGSEE